MHLVNVEGRVSGTVRYMCGGLEVIAKGLSTTWCVIRGYNAYTEAFL